MCRRCAKYPADILASMKAHVTGLKEIHDDATCDSHPKEGPCVSCLRLSAHVRQRDAALREQPLRVSKLARGISERDAEARRPREPLQPILSPES